jgi:branched-chain amino acid transport system substrate-binding protein
MSHLSSKSNALPRTLLSLLLCGAALGTALPALAAPVKVGLALDISGPFAALGAEARDGFALGIKQLGGKLGGRTWSSCRPTWPAAPTRPSSWSTA